MREGGSLETATGPIPDPSSVELNISDLRPFTRYSVFVTAVNRAGNSSTGSVNFTTAEAGESVMSHDSHMTVT